MDPDEQRSESVAERIRRILAAGFDLARNRAELAAAELEEERIHAVNLMLRLAALVILGALTLVAATALVAVLFWETSPGVVLGVITLVYAGATYWVARGLQTRLNTRPPPFAETTAALRKDSQWLRGND